MQFTPTPIAGAFLIEPKRISDDRGFFARTWCADTLAKQGLNPGVVQINTAHNIKAGTVRGMHFQKAPHAEVKIVHCPHGAIFDVVVDLRPDSPTYCRWHGAELSKDNLLALYIPEGCAHGYQALTDGAVMTYLTSAPYAAQSATGARFDDPAFGIEWPREITVMSAADRGWPLISKETPSP